MIRKLALLCVVFWSFIVMFSMRPDAVPAAETIDDTPGQMSWGVGDHYKLPIDSGGWSIVEPGRMHRKIYAAADGTRDNSGRLPDDPVDLKTGCRMIRAGSSDWLLLRRGDTFEQGVSLGENMLGESPLTPICIGAYGEGPRPIVRGIGAIKSHPRGNIVIRDLHLHGKGLKLLGSGKLENLLFENLLMDNASGAVITPQRVTIRRCVIKDCHRESPPNPKNKPDDGWAREPLRNRHQGLFANGVRGLLIEENVLDHNGWEEGYVESGGGPDDPQPPSMYSHNLYLSTENRDLTVRSNINARAASQALRDGSGQFYVGNVMIANNIGGYSGPDGGDGNYTTFADNVLIHPAAKRGPKIGGRGWGWSMKDVAGSQAIRNIFAHAPEGQNNEGLKLTEGMLVEDYVRYQWHEHEDLNPTGQPFPDPDRTIMTYDRDLGSGKGTLEAFMVEATAQEKDNWRRQYTAEPLVEYFQMGFGIWPGRRTEPTTVAFTANGGDQVRWDNWRNWSTGDLPINGDTVRLDGHEVYYSGTLDLKSLALGDSGVLRIHQGQLKLADPDGLTTGPQGGDVHLDRSGYLILNGRASDNPIDFFVRNGRLENRGNVDARSPFRIEARGGEMRLAGGGNTVSLGSGSSLRLVGHSVQAGCYGNTSATITFQGDAALSFTCDEQGASTLGEIGGDDLTSTLVIAGENTVLEVDLSQLRLPPGEHQLVLVNVDRLEGRFASENISGVPSASIAEAKIVHDESAGEISVHLISSEKNSQP
jgi:hypothetical protein